MKKSEFWNHVDRTGSCWEWKKGRFDNGYGCVVINQRTMGAHRAAWELAFGPIPKGLCVCHKCDNKPCCNPEHLFIGTKGDNNRDTVAKCRARPIMGSKHFSAKLSEQDVATIRRRYAFGEVKQLQLAAEYGVSATTICQAISGTVWRHVPGAILDDFRKTRSGRWGEHAHS